MNDAVKNQSASYFVTFEQNIEDALSNHSYSLYRELPALESIWRYELKGQWNFDTERSQFLCRNPYSCEFIHTGSLSILSPSDGDTNYLSIGPPCTPKDDESVASIFGIIEMSQRDIHQIAHINSSGKALSITLEVNREPGLLDRDGHLWNFISLITSGISLDGKCSYKIKFWCLGLSHLNSKA